MAAKSSQHDASLSITDPEDVSGPHLYEPDEIPSSTSHTMNGSILNYIVSRIHPEIQRRAWQEIQVVGLYDRTPPSEASDREKSHKLFNWHRPSTFLLEPNKLQLRCFPSVEYVRHYALIVATYLKMQPQRQDTLLYQVPSLADCNRPFLQSNLGEMGNVDIVVIGYVEHLRYFQQDCWYGNDEPCHGASQELQEDVVDLEQSGSQRYRMDKHMKAGRSDDTMFRWQKFKTRTSHTVALLGCMPSFWGDAAGHLVRALQIRNQVECVIYIGKAGTLRPEVSPNACIATGHTSFVGEKEVSWNNVLANDAAESSLVVEGRYVTVPSPLCESNSWLAHWRSRCSWVDCETSYMAEASNSGGTSFGHLHIISDNVVEPFPDDLSNEGSVGVKLQRQVLYREIESILVSFFDRWGGRRTNGIT